MRLGLGCFEIDCRTVVSTHSLTRRAPARGSVRLVTFVRRWAWGAFSRVENGKVVLELAVL